MTAEERAKIFKALADPRRVEIVDLLSKCSQCGTDLAESLGISMALLCHHWDVLVDAGILRKERVGQKRICTLDTARIREATGEWEPPLDGEVASVEVASREASAAAKGKGALVKAAGAAAKSNGAAKPAAANGAAKPAVANGAAKPTASDGARPRRRPRKRALK